MLNINQVIIQASSLYKMVFFLLKSRRERKKKVRGEAKRKRALKQEKKTQCSVVMPKEWQNMYYRNQKLREVFMAQMTGGRRNEPGLVQSLKDRHILNAESKKKDSPQCGENTNLYKNMRLRSVCYKVLESECWNHLGSFQVLGEF